MHLRLLKLEQKWKLNLVTFSNKALLPFKLSVLASPTVTVCLKKEEQKKAY